MNRVEQQGEEMIRLLRALVAAGSMELDDGGLGEDIHHLANSIDNLHDLITPLVPKETDRLVDRACEVMHDAYEQAAARFQWETQKASRKPWAEVPEANKATMRAAVKALLEWLREEKV